MKSSEGIMGTPRRINRTSVSRLSVFAAHFATVAVTMKRQSSVCRVLQNNLHPLLMHLFPQFGRIQIVEINTGVAFCFRPSRITASLHCRLQNIVWSRNHTLSYVSLFLHVIRIRAQNCIRFPGSETTSLSWVHGSRACE